MIFSKEFQSRWFHYSFIALILFFLQACNANTSATIEIQAPWIRTPPTSAQAIAGFMLLKNHSNQPIALTGANAKGFQNVMLHQSINENRMHRMKHEERIIIPAKGEVRFQHGSYHIMLMGIQKKIQSGDSIPITLFFDNGEEKSVSFIVKNPD